MLSVKQETVNTNFKVIGLTRLGIKPKSTAPEADALTTRTSELSTPYLNLKSEVGKRISLLYATASYGKREDSVQVFGGTAKMN